MKTLSQFIFLIGILLLSENIKAKTLIHYDLVPEVSDSLIHVFSKQMKRKGWYDCRSEVYYKLSENLMDHELISSFEKTWDKGYFEGARIKEILINPNNQKHQLKLEYREKCYEDTTSFCIESSTDSEGNTTYETNLCTDTETHSLNYSCEVTSFDFNNKKMNFRCNSDSYVSYGMKRFMKKLQKPFQVDFSLVKKFEEERLYDYNCDGDYSSRYEQAFKIDFQGGLDSYATENDFNFYAQIDSARVLQRKVDKTRGYLNFSILYCGWEDQAIDFKFGASEEDLLSTDIYKMEDASHIRLHIPGRFHQGELETNFVLKRKGNKFSNGIRSWFKDISGKVKIIVSKFQLKEGMEVILEDGQLESQKSAAKALDKK